MKLFQQLLVAPAALGLLASGANAAELNINGVSDYAASADQVTSVTQFSDVYPTDWAYQALSNLVDQYGCVAGYPNGTFRGNRAMTRYEAAALLNACLDRVTEVTDEVRRLVAEFETELAVLRGRVDGLEAKVGQLEATQFSTTTKLKGRADFFIGGVSGDGASVKAGEAVNFTYRYRLNMNTSFNGEDLLYARLQADSGKDTWTEGNATHLNDSGSNEHTLTIDKIWYTFPVGDFRFTVGPKIENYYMVETPTRYSPILKALKLGGYGSVMGASSGAGAGIQWRQNVGRGEPAFNAALNYVSADGDSSSAGAGLVGNNTASALLTQLGYGTRKWWVGALYTRKTEKGGSVIAGQSNDGTFGDSMNALGLRGFYTPESSGVMPTISAGVDFGSANGVTDGDTTRTFGYMVGLNWDDVFVDGNKAGMAYGSIGSYITDTQGTAAVDKDNSAFELWYQYQVTDNISIKPAVFWTNNYTNDADDAFGALVQTTFKF